MKEEDITWELIIEECLKRPEDSISQVFLDVQAKLDAQQTIIRDQSGWLAEQKDYAELAKEHREHIEDESVYVACIAENAALVDVAREVVSSKYLAISDDLGVVWSVDMEAIDKLSALLQSEGEI